MNKFTMSALGLSAALLAACSTAPEPMENDIIAMYAKDGSATGYQRSSHGVEVDADGNELDMDMDDSDTDSDGEED